jgi:DNA-binding response OmpR family regulator
MHTHTDLRTDGSISVLHHGADTSPEPHDRRALALVVNADPHIRTQLAACLDSAGITVIVARDVPDALRRARTLRPDAVVTGIDLPGGDGWHLARRLRGDLRLVAMPIVVFGDRAHHSIRSAGLNDVHAVDTLLGAQAVAGLLAALLPGSGTRTTQHEQSSETQQPSMERCAHGRRPGETPRAVPSDDAWIPHVG